MKKLLQVGSDVSISKRKKILPPSKKESQQILSLYFDSEDPDVTQAFIEECNIRYIKIEKKKFCEEENYSNKIITIIDTLNHNITLYKDLLYQIDIYKELIDVQDIYEEPTKPLNKPKKLKIEKVKLKLEKVESEPTKPKQKRVRRTLKEINSEKAHFCYIFGCDKCFTVPKALNQHIRKYHSIDEPRKAPEEMIRQQRTKPSRFLNKPNKRVMMTSVFSLEFQSRKMNVIEISANNDISQKNDSNKKLSYSKVNITNKEIKPRSKSVDKLKDKGNRLQTSFEHNKKKRLTKLLIDKKKDVVSVSSKARSKKSSIRNCTVKKKIVKKSITQRKSVCKKPMKDNLKTYKSQLNKPEEIYLPEDSELSHISQCISDMFMESVQSSNDLNEAISCRTTPRNWNKVFKLSGN